MSHGLDIIIEIGADKIKDNAITQYRSNVLIATIHNDIKI